MKHGLPTIAARDPALFGMAGELPPIIISDLFGVHRNTATQWAVFAQDSGADYLAALRATEQAVLAGCGQPLTIVRSTSGNPLSHQCP